METPTRRDLFKYAVGATLASALPVTAQDHGDPTLLPLIVEMTGPMGFIMGTGAVEIRLPKLSPPDDHQGTVKTAAGTLQLDGDDYSFSFETPPPHPHPAPSIDVTKPCKVYGPPDADPNSATSNFIHLKLPMPNKFHALSGFRAWIYPLDPSATTPQPNCTSDISECTLYAGGLRFQYNHAGTPTLRRKGYPAQTIPLDIADFDNQVNISISYDPVNLPDDGWENHSKKAFSQLASLFGLKRAIEIESDKCHCKGLVGRGNHRPCSLVMVVTGRAHG